MAQHVHKIVDDGDDRLAFQFMETVCQALAGLKVGDLVVRGLSRHPQTGEKPLLQGLFMCVFGPLLVLSDPQIGHHAGDVTWRHAGKERVSRVLSRRGQNAEIGLLLDHIPLGPERGCDGPPLVPTQVVDDHQKHRATVGTLHCRWKPLGKDPMRHHGRLLQTRHPRLVMVFDKAHELVVGFRMLVFQNLQHASVL